MRRTFLHLTGIGPRTERHLWGLGITDWSQLQISAGQIFKGKRLDDLRRALDDSLAAWDRGDLYYFDRTLPGNQRWRLITEAGANTSIAYFDIEADSGGMPPKSQSTAIAFYFHGELLQEFEHARKRKLIERMLAEAKVICTYNGAAYDIPFLVAEYGIPFTKPHIDLCPWLRRQGFKGGLKGIQKAMPHLRQRDGMGSHEMEIDGFDAITLWQFYQRNVAGSLDALLTYNAEDAIILEPLLIEAFNREACLQPGLNLKALRARPTPQLATFVDPSVYRMLRAIPRPVNPWITNAT